MNLKELHSFKMSDAIALHDELNPRLFNGDKMDPQVRDRLLEIAEDFIEHLGIDNFDVDDVTMSGSSAAYSYTPHSDIDLHITTDLSKYPDNDVYRELFDAKKNVYNETHNIKIGPYDVELYVQDTAQPHVSLGDYSVLRDEWNKHPIKRRENLDTDATKLKFEKLAALAIRALRSKDLEKVENVIATIKKYRQAGLDEHGEFGPENLAFKALRTQGLIKKLFDLRNKLHADAFSIAESASGYIPSNAQRNDPRFSTALTVDVKPDSIQQNAKKLGSKISRAGIPPLLRP